MKIVLDAMGGDNAPDANIKGAVNAINKVKAEIILVGKEEVIRSKIKEFYGKELEEISDRLKIKNATETIEMEDVPTVAIRHKKDSSMVVGFKMLKEGEGDVFISAGNSGALLTGATLIVGRIKGIDRPALAGILPAYKSRLLLIDAGSNTNCKPINLLQFAQMSTIYLKNTYGIENPAIGLLNIGTEETKGNDLVKESYKLLKENSEKLGINFVGNVEGRDAFSGKITGNINCNVLSGLTNVDMTGSGMSAVNAIDAAAGISNALSGTLGFTAKLKLNAFASDFNAMMKSVSGDVTFDVKDGHYANIGRLDNLLLAQNLAANAILKAALAPVRNMPVVQNTSNFKTINGSLSLQNGIAKLKSVKSAGPSLAYFVTGQYNLLSGYTNVVILGRLGADVVKALGPLGELSVSKLTSYIPKFGTQTASILSALTSDPKSENTDQIPGLSTGDNNTKNFKVVFTGNVTSASSIKSFKWLSTCDTSAITGGSLKEQLKTTTEALKTNHKNNVEAVKQNVEDVKEAAKNTVDNVKDKIQKTKDSIQELKNLFKKPATSEP